MSSRMYMFVCECMYLFLYVNVSVCMRMYVCECLYVNECMQHQAAVRRDDSDVEFDSGARRRQVLLEPGD